MLKLLFLLILSFQLAPLAADLPPPTLLVADMQASQKKESAQTQNGLTLPPPPPATSVEEATSDANTESDLTPPQPSGDGLALLDGAYKGQFVRMVIAIIVILVVLLVVVWLIRRFANLRPLQMNHQKYIKILERRPLSPQTFLYYLQVGDQHIILAESKVEIRTVATLDLIKDKD